MGIENTRRDFAYNNSFADKNGSFKICICIAVWSSDGYVSGYFNGQGVDSLIDTALFKRADEVSVNISRHRDIDRYRKASAMHKLTTNEGAYGNVNLSVLNVGEIFLNSEGNGTFKLVDVDGIGIDGSNAGIGVRDVFEVLTGDFVFFKNFSNAFVNGGSGKGFCIDFSKAVYNGLYTDFKEYKKSGDYENKYKRKFWETSVFAAWFYGHGKHPCIIIYGSAENVKRKEF